MNTIEELNMHLILACKGRYSDSSHIYDSLKFLISIYTGCEFNYISDKDVFHFLYDAVDSCLKDKGSLKRAIKDLYSENLPPTLKALNQNYIIAIRSTQLKDFTIPLTIDEELGRKIREFNYRDITKILESIQ